MTNNQFPIECVYFSAENYTRADFVKEKILCARLEDCLVDNFVTFTENPCAVYVCDHVKGGEREKNNFYQRVAISVGSPMSKLTQAVGRKT